MVQVDVLLGVFVEVDSVGGVSCGCSNIKHKIRYGAGAGINDAKAACI
jgi:hypothetical protein